MKKFCPKCRGEFTEILTVCPTDKLKLTSELPKSKIAKFVDVYAACDEVEAERIVSFFLSEGIAAAEYERGIAQVPSLGDVRHIIKVPADFVMHAKKRLEQARHDGVISRSGTFL